MPLLFLILAVLALSSWLLWSYLQKPAYIVRGNLLLRPNGEVIPEYDGNDPKHFPKWRPYVAAKNP